jgi:hypothetical protein
MAGSFVLGFRLLVGSLAAAAILRSPAEKRLVARQADGRAGATTVRGTVVSARYASWSKGEPTSLNLDEPYPRHVFAIVIWGSDRSKFGQPERDYLEKAICVTGKITEYRGMPEDGGAGAKPDHGQQVNHCSRLSCAF